MEGGKEGGKEGGDSRRVGDRDSGTRESQRAVLSG